MRKSIVILLLIITSVNSFSQYNPRPTKSHFWNSNRSTFTVKAGDILVYQVDEGGKKYDLIVTVKKFNDGINFNYSLPERNIRGNATITSTAFKATNSYDNSFINNTKSLQNKNALWLSKDNFRELASGDKQTTMDMGNGVDTFVRHTTSTQKVLYKGKEKIMTVYEITNTSGGNELAVLTDMNNPLIVKMDMPMKAILKEVR